MATIFVKHTQATPWENMRIYKMFNGNKDIVKIDFNQCFRTIDVFRYSLQGSTVLMPNLKQKEAMLTPRKFKVRTEQIYTFTSVGHIAKV